MIPLSECNSNLFHPCPYSNPYLHLLPYRYSYPQFPPCPSYPLFPFHPILISIPTPSLSHPHPNPNPKPNASLFLSTSLSPNYIIIPKPKCVLNPIPILIYFSIPNSNNILISLKKPPTPSLSLIPSMQPSLNYSHPYPTIRPDGKGHFRVSSLPTHPKPQHPG